MTPAADGAADAGAGAGSLDGDEGADDDVLVLEQHGEAGDAAPADATMGRRSVGSGLAFGAGSFAFTAVLGLGSSLVTSRLYGVTTIGAYALATLPWLLLIQLSTVSEQVAVVRRLASVRPRDPVVAAIALAVLGFSTLLSAVVSAVVIGVCTPLLRARDGGASLFLPAIVICAGYVLLDNVAWNLESVLSAFQAGPQLFVVRAVKVVTFLGAAVALHAWSDSVWGLVWATVAQFAAGLLAAAVLVRRFLSLRVSRADLRAGRAELPALLRFGAKVAPGDLLSGATSLADGWFLGLIVGRAEFGAYSRASGLAIRLQDASFRVNEIVFPTLVRAHEQGDRAALERTLLGTLRILCTVLGVAIAVAAGLAPAVLGVFGPGFDVAAPAFALLVWGYLGLIASYLFTVVLQAIDRPGDSSKTALVRVVVLAVALPALGFPFGMTGVAGALALGFAVEAAVRARLVARHALAPGGGRSLALLAGRVALAGAGGTVVTRLVLDRIDGFAGVAAGAVAGAIVYVVAAAAVRLVRPADLRRPPFGGLR